MEHSHQKLYHRVQLSDMTPEEIAATMNKASAGRLGTIGPDGPYVVPLAFAWLNNTVYFHCHTAGKKLNNIETDNRICFQADLHSDDTLTYESVIVSGKAQLVEGEEVMDAMNALLKKYSSELKLPKMEGMKKIVKVFKVADAKITGKKSVMNAPAHGTHGNA